MRDSRPISNADEFQIIDIGNLALREEECNSLFLKEYNNMERDQKSNLTVE